jgi:hypothetical protein
MMENLTWQQIAELVSADTYPHEILREGNKEGLVARATKADGSSAVLKFWKRTGLRGALRRLTQTGTAYLERNAQQHLIQHNLRVPKVYGVYHMRNAGARHTECLVQEDLGVCRDATEVLKQYILDSNTDAVDLFEKEIISSTCIMVESGLLDVDHRLPNYVVPPTGKPVRLDFELAKRVRFLGLETRQYGTMLGTLLGSYVFAVQPDQVRMEQFAEKLVVALKPPKAVLHIAGERIANMIDRQKKEAGIDTAFTPPWNKGEKL